MSANAAPPRTTPREPVPWIFLIVTLGVLGALGYLAVRNWPYYSLPWAQRFEAPDHRALRSSGESGHLYGYIGLGLILGNLLYLVRRRLPTWTWLGSMRAWMRWHVFTGLVGPAFIVLHSAFTMRTWPAKLSAVALLIVVATGLFGRYLYRLLPRGPAGDPRSHEELAGEIDRALIALRAHGEVGIATAELVEAQVAKVVADAASPRRSGLRAIGRTLRAMWRVGALRAMARQAAEARGASPAVARDVGRQARRVAGLILRADAIDTMSTAASTWRGLHRNLVLVMLVSASLHVSIAVFLGYV